MTNEKRKPLGIKTYGSIGHLPGSRIGPGDHHVHEGQARIVTEKKRDRHDAITVQEKLDGSCTAVAKVEGQILALGRAGYLAWTSPFEMHHLFAQWVAERETMFDSLLIEGERLVGEWLYQAHGTKYDLPHEPWVVFDIMRGHERASYSELSNRMLDNFRFPYTVQFLGDAISIESVLKELGPHGHHGALEPIEGAVWRVERRGEFDFMAKYVRPDKIDGSYLPNVSGEDPVWNQSTWEVTP